MSVQTVLQNARALIADGWVQGISAKVTPTGKCYCTLGALSQAAFDVTNCRMVEADYTGTKAMLKAVIAPGREVSLPLWNDHRFRTQEQVLATFDQAIACVPA